MSGPGVAARASLLAGWLLGPGVGGALAATVAPTEDYLCGAEWIVVVEVTESKFVCEQDAPISMWTRAELTVKSVARGAPPQTITMHFVGGQCSGRSSWVSEVMAPRVGDQYLLFLDPLTAPAQDVIGPGGLPSTEPDIRMWWAIPRDAVIPPSAVLSAIWTEHCTSDADRPRPTEQYLEWIPPEILKICQHRPPAAETTNYRGPPHPQQ